jgi:hypothetical protein
MKIANDSGGRRHWRSAAHLRVLLAALTTEYQVR